MYKNDLALPTILALNVSQHIICFFWLNNKKTFICMIVIRSVMYLMCIPHAFSLSKFLNKLKGFTLMHLNFFTFFVFFSLKTMFVEPFRILFLNNLMRHQALSYLLLIFFIGLLSVPSLIHLDY